MVMVPKGMLSGTQQVPVSESLEGSERKVIARVTAAGSWDTTNVLKAVDLVNGWEWRDPAALPTAHKTTEHLMISAFLKFCCFATATALEGKVRVYFSKWHTHPVEVRFHSCGDLWPFTVCVHDWQRVPGKMEIFYRKMENTVFFILHFMADHILLLLKGKSSYTKKMKF